MPQTGTVHYHVHAPDRQAFHIDAGGVSGEVIAPELVKTAITLRDLRRGEATVSFAQDGLAFLQAPSAIASFETATESPWRSRYDQELSALLTETLAAAEVVIFDHTLRIDAAAAERRPARNVHNDYSREGARQRLIEVLGPERAEAWEGGHYAFINVWRPVGAPINTAPLGFVRPASIAPEDWILLDLIYPDRIGQILGLTANPAHDWVYLSKMTRDEVALFTIYDNTGAPTVAHSAVDLIEDPSVHSIRKSLESRTLVRFAEGG
ncbi:MAG: CmcJ/NvfI family oxidoreductase [Rhodospirillaceae bacterium]